MSLKTVSTLRTDVREAFIAGLEDINADKTGTYYSKQIKTTAFFVNEDEIKAGVFPVFCVILTDEELTYQQQRSATVQGKMMIVGYVRSESDPRKALDEAIEDAIHAITNHDPIKNLLRKLQLLTITTDEAVLASKPFGQFLMEWGVWFERPMF